MNEPTVIAYDIANMIQELAKQHGDEYAPNDTSVSYAYQTGFLKSQIAEILEYVPKSKRLQISEEILYRLKK
jgi:hypothetical protein